MSDQDNAANVPTNAQRLAAGLRRHGITVVFGQSIPAALLLAAPEYGIRQIGYRTENAGGIMADGFARISGRITAVTAQNGPAATLLVAPMAEALKASVPMLVLVEEVPASDVERNAFQEFDHVTLFRPVAKWIARIDHPQRLDDLLDLAVVTATSGRPGPVVLLLPRDMLVQRTAVSPYRQARLGEFPLDRQVPAPEAVSEAARLILEAKRPLVIAGGGVHLSGGAEALERLCQNWALPVATTNMGKGAIAETHPLALGVFGNCMGKGTTAAELRHYVTDADLLLLIGTRTNQNGTDAWTLYPPEAKIIHIDIDGIEIGRNYESVRLLGDARETLRILDAAMAAHEPDRGALLARAEVIGAQTHDARRRASVITAEWGAGTRGSIRPEALMRVLDTRLRPDDIVTSDASYSTNWMTSFLTARRSGQRFVAPRGLAGLGWGVPLAMGAKLAAPGSRVIALVGDGGFGHCWSEIETARRMNIDVKVIVLNNQILGYQKHGESAFFGAYSDACDFTAVDHAAIARACGLEAFTLEDPADLESAVDRLLASQGPALMDVMTDDQALPPLNQFVGRNTVAPVRAWKPAL